MACWGELAEQEPVGVAQTMLLNVCDAPQAQFGQIAPLALACPFGTSQTPHTGGLRRPEWHG